MKEVAVIHALVVHQRDEQRAIAKKDNDTIQVSRIQAQQFVCVVERGAKHKLHPEEGEDDEYRLHGGRKALARVVRPHGELSRWRPNETVSEREFRKDEERIDASNAGGKS